MNSYSLSRVLHKLHWYHLLLSNNSLECNQGCVFLCGYCTGFVEVESLQQFGNNIRSQLNHLWGLHAFTRDILIFKSLCQIEAQSTSSGKRKTGEDSIFD